VKKVLLFVVIIAIAAAAGMFLKSQKEALSSLHEPKIYHTRVDTAKAQEKTVSETRHFLAQVLASKSALIASKFSAEIKKVHVKENDMVKKGQILIALDDAEIKANIASAKQQKHALSMDVENAKRSLERSKKLYKAEAISQEKYDNANVFYQNKVAALENIQEKIKQLYAQLKYLNITAPFSGRVGTIFVDAGNLAIPGKPIISLNSDDQKLIFSYVETSQSITEGQKVLIDGKVVGTVARRYDDAKNAMLVAEVKLDKSLPYANKSYVNIDVVVAQMKGCAIPLNAILHRKDANVIMLYKDGHFEPSKVDILLQDYYDAILSKCPETIFATASEAKLALLPTLGHVIIDKEK
jgi:RND family efflux transporter MFP subunit